MRNWFAGLSSMARRSSPLWWSAIGLIALPALAGPSAATSAASGAIGNFTVKANPRLADGQPWRGTDGVFANLPFVTPTLQTKSAPSFILCTVALDGVIACPGADGFDQYKRPASPCHLSYDCEFNDIPLPPGRMFGVVVLSMGIVENIFGDAVVFAREKTERNDPEYLAFDARLHEAVNKLAQTSNRDELSRRRRPFQLFVADYCVRTSCSLRQTEMTMEMP